MSLSCQSRYTLLAYGRITQKCSLHVPEHLGMGPTKRHGAMRISTRRKTQVQCIRTLEFNVRQSLIEPASSADNNLLSSRNSTHVTSPSCPDRVANMPWSVGDCPRRKMTARTKGEPDLRVPKRNKLSRAKRDKRGARGSRSAIESISRS